MTEKLQDTGTVPLPLDGWHRAQGARMVPFAGYAMPIQYAREAGGGIMAEHAWTRTSAGLFDVSHMGQLTISGKGATAAIEALIPADLASLRPGRVRYSLLLGPDGGILDDLMVTNAGEADGDEVFHLVVNGAMKGEDILHIQSHLAAGVSLTHQSEQALLALQGPKAAAVLDDLLPGIADEIVFMQAIWREWNGIDLQICRSGYTGEDGFEISVPAQAVEVLAEALVADERVRPVGLGARDSLRLEAGLPLYGHDLNPDIDPVTADLAFAVSKRRRATGGFPGHERIVSLLEEGPSARRVGLEVEGRAPAREGAAVFAGDKEVGQVTSGGFSPTLGRPIAMAYVDSDVLSTGAELAVELRGRRVPARIAPLPFVPHTYRRQGGK